MTDHHPRDLQRPAAPTRPGGPAGPDWQLLQMAGSGRDPPADWATREPLPQWQHLDDGSEDDRRYMGSKVSHLSVVGLGWATIVGGSIAHSILDPSKRHLLLSHRLIHARLTAQWYASSRPPPTHSTHHTPSTQRPLIGAPSQQHRCRNVPTSPAAATCLQGDCWRPHAGRHRRTLRVEGKHAAVDAQARGHT